MWDDSGMLVLSLLACGIGLVLVVSCRSKMVQVDQRATAPHQIVIRYPAREFCPTEDWISWSCPAGICAVPLAEATGLVCVFEGR